MATLLTTVVPLSRFSCLEPRCELRPPCASWRRQALTAAACCESLPCVRQLSESRCLCTWARRSRDITGASILHAEQLWRDFRVDGQPGCAAGSFGSCEIVRMHGHFDQRHQREVSLNACRRTCATCLPKWAPTRPYGQEPSLRSRGSWLLVPHVVLESPCYRCASGWPLGTRQLCVCVQLAPTARALLMATCPMQVLNTCSASADGHDGMVPNCMLPEVIRREAIGQCYAENRTIT